MKNQKLNRELYPEYNFGNGYLEIGPNGLNKYTNVIDDHESLGLNPFIPKNTPAEPLRFKIMNVKEDNKIRTKLYPSERDLKKVLAS